MLAVVNGCIGSPSAAATSALAVLTSPRGALALANVATSKLTNLPPHSLHYRATVHAIASYLGSTHTKALLRPLLEQAYRSFLQGHSATLALTSVLPPALLKQLPNAPALQLSPTLLTRHLSALLSFAHAALVPALVVALLCLALSLILLPRPLATVVTVVLSLGSPLLVLYASIRFILPALRSHQHGPARVLTSLATDIVAARMQYVGVAIVVVAAVALTVSLVTSHNRS
jgi:hypothetical protein